MSWKSNLQKTIIESSWDGQKEWVLAEQESVARGWGVDLAEEIYFQKRFKFIFKNDLFDKSKFPWDSNAAGYDAEWKLYLLEMFSDEVATWWQPTAFPTFVFDGVDMSLYEQCKDNFKVWYDKNKVNWKKDIMYLLDYNQNDIAIWWDPDKFDWNRGLFLLFEKDLLRHSDVWFDDYKEAVEKRKFKEDKFLNFGM